MYLVKYFGSDKIANNKLVNPEVYASSGLALSMHNYVQKVVVWDALDDEDSRGVAFQTASHQAIKEYIENS